MTMADIKIQMLKFIILALAAVLGFSVTASCLKGCHGRQIPAGVGIEKSA